MVQKTQLSIGDKVYARYHGDDLLTIVGVANTKSIAPHYICEIDGKRYIISKLQLSRARISPETGDSNRIQLSFVNSNA